MRSNSSRKPADPALLPSVDEVLAHKTAVDLISDLGRERVVAFVRSLIAKRRTKLLEGHQSDGAIERSTLIAGVVDELAALGDAEQRSGVRRVINATGVIIHTNLGRAPLSERAAAAMTDASGYSAIEYDVQKG
jgi:L-seryl-tRNA(Ser) seleniumtransferase